MDGEGLEYRREGKRYQCIICQLGDRTVTVTGWTWAIGVALFHLGGTGLLNGLLLMSNISANKKSRLHSGTRGWGNHFVSLLAYLDK